ncbi:MAG: hypothetical protein ACRDZR_07050 [Acidimicrobiales bacterium]
MTHLGDKVLALHRALAAHHVPHAMGGAIALAYAVRQARATHDVDVNVFVPVDDAERVFRALPPGITVRPGDAEAVCRDGQVRLRWGDTPVDLFFSTVHFHDVATTRTRDVPFEQGSIPVLSATDLVVCKALYGRGKDWVDIEAMRDAGTVDAPEALRWVAALVGPDHPHYRRLFEIVTTPAAPSGDTDRLPPALRPRGRPSRPPRGVT